MISKCSLILRWIILFHGYLLFDRSISSDIVQCVPCEKYNLLDKCWYSPHPPQINSSRFMCFFLRRLMASWMIAECIIDFAFLLLKWRWCYVYTYVILLKQFYLDIVYVFNKKLPIHPNNSVLFVESITITILCLNSLYGIKFCRGIILYDLSFCLGLKVFQYLLPIG